MVPEPVGITLRVARIKGLKEKDVIDSITREHVEYIKTPDIETHKEYFWNNIDYAIVEEVDNCQ